VLRIEGLSKSFGALRVADDVSFQVSRGAAVGVIGPNGAGKTTFLNLISGDLHGDTGRIAFKDKDVTKWGARQRAHAGIARTYQIPQPFHGMTVFENVLVGAVFAGGRSQSQSRQHCEEILDRTNLLRFANHGFDDDGGNGRGIVDWQELCQLVGEMRPSVMAIVYASLASRSTRIVPEFPMQRRIFQFPVPFRQLMKDGDTWGTSRVPAVSVPLVA